jgi:hypothetical protein
MWLDMYQHSVEENRINQRVRLIGTYVSLESEGGFSRR